VNPRALRTIAGIAVLVLLGLIAIRLIPPYVENFRLQQYVNDLAADAATASQAPESIRASIVHKAAELGLPVRDADVRVTRTETVFKIQVLYLVHVDLPGYSVDLHFRPAAGGT
jgi:hypothetical protein